LAEFANAFIHDISHWLGPAIILVFGSYILGRALYKSRHIHSDECGHIHNKFHDTKVENPITIGILTGMLPCASSFAVVIMTGMTPTISEIIQFISIYVLGIALVLFIVVITFNYTKNIFIEKMSNFKFNINPELVSGCLIMMVGFIYLSYNWMGHIH